jgi:hypothetical protein
MSDWSEVRRSGAATSKYSLIAWSAERLARHRSGTLRRSPFASHAWEFAAIDIEESILRSYIGRDAAPVEARPPPFQEIAIE